PAPFPAALCHLRLLFSHHSFLLHDPATTEIYTLSLHDALPILARHGSWPARSRWCAGPGAGDVDAPAPGRAVALGRRGDWAPWRDRKSTRLNSSHVKISYAVFCLKKKTR